MTHKTDVRFPVEGNVELHAWLFTPEGTGPLPAISMAHGLAFAASSTAAVSWFGEHPGA
jgi:hypothetical protein